MVQPMKLHEMWRHTYRQQRYLEHATSKELRQRQYDLMDNMCDFTAEGKLSFRDPREKGEWLEYFTHLLEEFALRGEEIAADRLFEANFDLRRYVNLKRASELWKGHELPIDSYFLKFSKLKYLRPLLNVGNLRILPASYYQDSSMNFAIQDSELKFTQELYGAKVHFPPNSDYSIPKEQWTEMPIIGNAKSTFEALSDYYISCFSSSYEYRLFDDFEANACLVIKDIVRFAKSLKTRMEEILPEWRFSYEYVNYQDPYHPIRKLNIFFSKHFRYAYQKEFRFVWEPSNKAESLRPIFLELGPLRDYCELLVL
jgi:hypothetical protein